MLQEREKAKARRAKEKARECRKARATRKAGAKARAKAVQVGETERTDGDLAKPETCRPHCAEFTGYEACIVALQRSFGLRDPVALRPSEVEFMRTNL